MAMCANTVGTDVFVLNSWIMLCLIVQIIFIINMFYICSV